MDLGGFTLNSNGLILFFHGFGRDFNDAGDTILSHGLAGWLPGWLAGRLAGRMVAGWLARGGFTLLFYGFTWIWEGFQ